MFPRYRFDKIGKIIILLFLITSCSANHIYNENTNYFYGYDQENARIIYGRLRVRNETGRDITRFCRLGLFAANIKKSAIGSAVVSEGAEKMSFLRYNMQGGYRLYAMNAEEYSNKVIVKKGKEKREAYMFLLKNIRCQSGITYHMKINFPLLLGRDHNRTYFGDITIDIDRRGVPSGGFVKKVSVDDNLLKAEADLLKLVPELENLKSRKHIFKPKQQKKISPKRQKDNEKKVDDFLANF